MKINQNEVLGYLGYRGLKIEADIRNLIEACSSEILNLARPKNVYEIYRLESEADQIRLQESFLSFKSHDLQNHLGDSSYCAVMAVTLGSEVDKKIDYLAQSDLLKAMVMDATASTAIEAYGNEVCDLIRVLASKNGFFLTKRYSPGYGDFPLESQQQLLNLLNAYSKIGLTVTKSSLLIPRKSITAIVGLTKTPPVNAPVNKRCSDCKMVNCRLRREPKE